MFLAHAESLDVLRKALSHSLTRAEATYESGNHRAMVGHLRTAAGVAQQLADLLASFVSEAGRTVSR